MKKNKNLYTHSGKYYLKIVNYVLAIHYTLQFIKKAKQEKKCNRS